MTIFLSVLTILLWVAAIGCFGFAVMVAADPEGRGGSISGWCLGAALVCIVGSMVTGVWAVVHWVHG
jgi:hypothetical protein